MAASVASRPVSNGGKPRVVPIGTDVAILDLCRSGVALAEPGPLSSWGGARNRVDRESRFLSVAHAENIAAAAGHALQLGLPLNRHVTWHLEKSGVAPGDGAKAIGRFLKLHRQFLAARGQPFACVWVREDDDGDRSKGAHVHILMHVPSAVAPAVTRRQRRWLRMAACQPYSAGSLRTSRIGGTVRAAESGSLHYTVSLAKIVDYLLKGISAGAAERLRRSPVTFLRMLPLQRHGRGGHITGKRCGWSENVGAKARRAR